MCHKNCGCSCESNCSCHRNYMDTVCPEGFQGSGCILYNGDILKDLVGADYIYSNTSLNTVIKQMWTKILAGGSSTDLTAILADIEALKTQMTTVISNIGDLTTLTTTAKGNLVAAINEIDADLTALTTLLGDLSTLNNLPGVTTQATTFVGAINDRQPVWKKSLDVVIGASQAAPFNDINAAIDELAKYHFNSNLLVFKLEDGTHTITPSQFHKMNINSYTVESISGNRADCILTSSGITINNGLQTSNFKNLTIKSSGTGSVIETFSNNGHTRLDNCVIETGAANTSCVISGESGHIRLTGCKIVNKATAAIKLVIASNMGKVISNNLEVDNSAGNAGSNLYLAQVNSNIEVSYNNPASTTIVNNINVVYTAYSNSNITIFSFDTYTYSNIGIFAQTISGNCSITHRCQTSGGVTKPTTINSKSSNTNTALFINEGVFNSTPLTISSFPSVFVVTNQSKLSCAITATGLTIGSIIDRHSDVILDGSSLTSSQTSGTVIFAGTSSRLDFRNGQVLGNSGTSVKFIADSNASIYAVGSNLTTTNSTIVAPAILMV